MQPLLPQFAHACRPLIPSLQPGDRVAVGVSGGADSVALLQLCLRLPLVPSRDLVVLHFNHNIRPTARADAEFVRRLAQSSNVSFATGRWQNRHCAPPSEAQLRHVRYRFLKKEAEAFGARWIMTAHTADDQAETILHQILRGSGMHGLSGMPRLRPLSESLMLCRPLLGIRRAALRDFLDSIQQPYCDDPSNRDLSFTRNRIRQQLIPAAQEIFKNDIVLSLCRIGNLARDQHAYLNRLTRDWISAHCKRHAPDQCELDRVSLRELPGVLRREVFVQIWRDHGWSRGQMRYEHWERLGNLAQGEQDQTESFPGGIRVRTETDRIVLSASRSPIVPI